VDTEEELPDTVDSELSLAVLPGTDVDAVEASVDADVDTDIEADVDVDVDVDVSNLFGNELSVVDCVVEPPVVD